MAQVELSVVITSLRGKTGNVVFVKGRDGYSVPTNPRTPVQEAVRARFVAATGTFPTLTAEQTAAWNTDART